MKAPDSKILKWFFSTLPVLLGPLLAFIAWAHRTGIDDCTRTALLFGLTYVLAVGDLLFITWVCDRRVKR